jgi:class I fructose-bisphosphate aldolase
MTTADLGAGVVVALDHGLHWGAVDGFERPAETLATVLEADPDGIVAGVPFLRRFRDRVEAAGVTAVGTLDLLHESTLPGDREDAEIHTRVAEPAAAAAVADAAKVALVYGRSDPAVLRANVELVATAADACRAAGLPLVVEPTLWGSRADDEFDPRYLAHAARTAFELGADVLKCPYPETGFDRIVDDAPVPVYIAGGPAVETDRDALEMVHDAVAAGAEGVMVGRNVWQRDDPAGVVAAMSAVVDDGASVEEATTRLTAP